MTIKLGKIPGTCSDTQKNHYETEHCSHCEFGI